MNKYSKQKLNKRTKNTAKHKNRISATFDCLFLSKAISTISNQIFYRIYAKMYVHISLYKSLYIAPNILCTIWSIVNGLLYGWYGLMAGGRCVMVINRGCYLLADRLGMSSNSRQKINDDDRR